IASKIASVTISGGYFLPSYQTGSSSLNQISVSIGPGFTIATWMFEPARSFHRPSLKAFMAALEAAYIASRGGATLAAKEETLTIVPRPWRSMWGVAGIVVHKQERELTRMTSSSTGESRVGTGWRAV